MEQPGDYLDPATTQVDPAVAQQVVMDILALPPETFEYICQFLTVRDLASLRLTSTQTRDYAERDFEKQWVIYMANIKARLDFAPLSDEAVVGEEKLALMQDWVSAAGEYMNTKSEIDKSPSDWTNWSKALAAAAEVQEVISEHVGSLGRLMAIVRARGWDMSNYPDLANDVDALVSYYGG